MADNKKTNKSTNKSVNKNKSLKNTKTISPTKKKKMEMNSDELLDQIINKKKKKKKKVDIVELPKLKSDSKQSVDKKNIELSNDELLEKIMNKKKSKKSSFKSNVKKENVEIELPKEKVKKELTEIPKLEFPKKDDTIITRSISLDEIKQLSDENEKTLLESELDIRDIREALELTKKKPNKKYLSKPNKVKKSSSKKTSTKVKKDNIDIKDKSVNKTIDIPKSNISVEHNDINLSTLVSDVNDDTNKVNKLSKDKNIKPQIVKEKNVKVKPVKEKVKKVKTVKEKNTNPSLEYNKTVFVYIILVILIITIIYLSFVLFNSFNYKNDEKYLKNNNSSSLQETEMLKKKALYEECLALPYNESDNTEVINEKINELNAYLDMYSVSVSYEDLNYGYTYQYMPSITYYAASTIKSLDALYIYTKAYEGIINLDDKIVYSKKYKMGASAYVGSYKIGTSFTIRELVKAAVMVSDNSAHHMLVDYIGYNNLKQFGRNLGATATLAGSDNFGYINVNDGIIYMKKLNEFFNNSGELGDELKSYFVESDENSLKTDTIEAATKYGEYAPVFHNIGVVYHEHPYVISVLTNEKKGDFEQKVRNINLKVMELHELYYSNRSDVCLSSVYGK